MRTRTCRRGMDAQCGETGLPVEETERCDPGDCPASVEDYANHDNPIALALSAEQGKRTFFSCPLVNSFFFFTLFR